MKNVLRTLIEPDTTLMRYAFGVCYVSTLFSINPEWQWANEWWKFAIWGFSATVWLAWFVMSFTVEVVKKGDL